uniref:Uncharacterized protein n=1 Tax=Timema shepardi TaxID=629360 RepID=A0A7R9B0W3_TIMSH|nr:unnamed protein product [Timema shepardi]
MKRWASTVGAHSGSTTPLVILVTNCSGTPLGNLKTLQLGCVHGCASLERETRIDTKRKNERSSIVFAFGSSMPRMLEPADTGGSFWGTRRATSTTNVMTFTAMPLTRRSSERELDGSKKRATSASGLDRKPGEDVKMSTSMYEIFHWDSAPGPSSHAPTAPRSLNLSGGRSRSYSSAPHTPSPRNASRGLSSAEEIEPATGETGSHNSSARVNRRKTGFDADAPFPSRRGTARPGVQQVAR